MKGHATPKVHLAPYAGPLRRKLREFWPDRNPLRRRWDRAEAAIVGGLLAAFVIGGTLAALIAGHWAYEGAQRTRHAELATLRQVPAVLLTTASEQPAGYYASAKAWWRAPDGARRTGQVVSLAGSPPGTTIEVWVDPAGRQVAPPLLPTQVQGQTVVTATLAVMAVAMVLWGAGLTAHCVAHQRRMAAWDDEWRAFGPKWSRHG